MRAQKYWIRFTLAGLSLMYWVEPCLDCKELKGCGLQRAYSYELCRTDDSRGHLENNVLEKCRYHSCASSV